MDTSTILSLTFLIALAFGAMTQRTHFCTMGAISDIVNMEDWTRMRMWLLAISIAILGATFLHTQGLIDLNKSIYRSGQLTWLSHLVGGLCFGCGMVLGSGCGAKTLTRIGAGNLKSFVVFLVVGITAYMTMRGHLAVFRSKVLDSVTLSLGENSDLASVFSHSFNLPAATGHWAITLLLCAATWIFVFKNKDFFSLDNLLAGIGVGLAVVALWYVSGHLGFVAEDPETLQEAFLATNSGRMESLTFVAPQAYLLDYLMLGSDSSKKLTIAIVSVLGVISGAAAYALISRTFRWEAFRDVEDTATHLIGAALMGFGGVTAMGCTIGQGLTGLSTLAIGSFLTFAAILLGGWATLKFQYWRIMR